VGMLRAKAEMNLLAKNIDESSRAHLNCSESDCLGPTAHHALKSILYLYGPIAV
jgi:hypothetical protein